MKNILRFDFSASLKIKTIIILLISLTTKTVLGQTNTLGPSYLRYYDYKNINPAFLAMQAKHTITTLYSGYPVDSYEGVPIRLYGSYELRLDKINSGIGTLINSYKIGMYSYLNASVFLSHQIKLNETSGLRLGTQLSYQKRKMDYALNSQNPDFFRMEEMTNGNIDLGLIYYSSIITVGVSTQNMINQEINGTNYNLILTREFKLNPWLMAIPSILHSTDFSNYETNLNSTLEIKKWYWLVWDTAGQKIMMATSVLI